LVQPAEHALRQAGAGARSPAPPLDAQVFHREAVTARLGQDRSIGGGNNQIDLLLGLALAQQPRVLERAQRQGTGRHLKQHPCARRHIPQPPQQIGHALVQTNLYAKVIRLHYSSPDLRCMFGQMATCPPQYSISRPVEPKHRAPANRYKGI
jgi:hypothetical protein